MKFADFFKSNKSSWALTGLLILMLMAVAAAPGIWTPTVPDNAEQQGGELTAPVIEQGAVNQQEDGGALPHDPDNSLVNQPSEQTANETPGFVPPLNGSIGRAYGYGYDPTYNDYRFHHGVDLTAEPGTPVYAAAAGEVAIARDDSYWGGIVTIEHAGGWQSVYRCLAPGVGVGDRVAAGDVVGNLMEKALTEAGQETHLHYELYLDGEEQDPAVWL